MSANKQLSFCRSAVSLTKEKDRVEQNIGALCQSSSSGFCFLFTLKGFASPAVQLGKSGTESHPFLDD